MSLREIEKKIYTIEFINYFYRSIIFMILIVSVIKFLIEEITVLDTMIFVMAFMLLLLPQFLISLQENEMKSNELKKLKKKYVNSNKQHAKK